MKFTEKGGRFWVADLHLGHAKVADLRGFANVREHDTHILEQLACLDSWDTLWILGDISSGKPNDESDALYMLQQCVQAEKHLIAGNHDSVSSANRNGYKHQREWLETFASVQQFGRVRISGSAVMMSHYPYARSGDGPGRGAGRHLEYRLPDVGMPLIHGHTHQDLPHMDKNANMPWMVSREDDLSQFCVSWDAHRNFVNEDQLNYWVAKFKRDQCLHGGAA